MEAPPLEAAISSLFTFFVHQKFVTIFSFLFGLGFSIQLARAAARGSPIIPLYSRRLQVLLGIGVAHLVGLWVGDVLSSYALMGFMSEEHLAQMRARFLAGLASDSFWTAQKEGVRYVLTASLPSSLKRVWSQEWRE